MIECIRCLRVGARLGPNGFFYGMRICLFVLACALALTTLAGATEAPRLGSPIDCAIPSSCIIQNYVDAEPGPDYRDHACQRLSYDGHKGTDFRVKRASDFRSGVIVQAAADGTVRAIRNDMPDATPGTGPTPGIDSREAGNAVAIRHDDGWETQYSHLRRGSIRVRPGQEVRKGHALGMVGLSGNTEFPHLHFALRHHGRAIDPFTGRRLETGCTESKVPLWTAETRETLSYIPTGVLDYGFTNRPPTLRETWNPAHHLARIEPNAPALIFWIKVFGIQPSDTLSVRLFDPEGRTLVSRDQKFDTAKAQYFSFVGKRRHRGRNWPSGSYRAEVYLERGATPSRLLRNASVRVAPKN